MIDQGRKDFYINDQFKFIIFLQTLH